MGLFGDIGKVFSGAAKAVATGGLSIVAPKLIPKSVNKVLDTVTKAQFPTSLSSVAKTGLAIATKNPALLLPSQGAQPMALNVGNILSGVGQVFGGNQNPYFQTISNVAGLASQFVPQPTSLAMKPAVQAGTAVMKSVGTVGRSFFNRYPNLATAMQMLRNQGKNVKRSQLYSLLKRFGPEFLITGGILTAAAVNELMIAGPGRRRMNPGNISALRRSMRRLESFHKVCVRADQLRRPRSRKGCKTTSSANFVRQG